MPFLLSIYVHQEPLLIGYDNTRAHHVPLCLYTILLQPSDSTILRSEKLRFSRGQSLDVVCVLVSINYLN
jgi:hypothetical protein